MLRIDLMQQWYSLSDSDIEEALIKVPTMRRFAVSELISERITDKTTTLTFRHLLEEDEIGRQFYCFAEDFVCEIVKANPKEPGMAMKQGTIFDATLIAATSSTISKNRKRDLEMDQTKKCSLW